MLDPRLMSFYFILLNQLSARCLTCSGLSILVFLKPIMTNSGIKHPGAESSFIMDHHLPYVPGTRPGSCSFCAVRHAGSVCHHRELPLSFHTGRGDRKLLPNRGEIQGTSSLCICDVGIVERMCITEGVCFHQ